MYFRLLLIALAFLAIFALFYLLFANRPSPRITRTNEPPAQVQNENFLTNQHYSQL